MPVRLPVLNNNRGVSLIELVIAGAILSGLALSAATLGTNLFKPLQNLSKNIYESIGQDFSVRGFAFQFTNSELMRGAADGTQWVSCSGNTALPISKASQTSSLAAIGDSYAFGFAQLRTLGATSPLQTNTIAVPDVSNFTVGMNVLVTSLDAAKNQGIFSITGIDPVLQTLALSDSVSQPPSEFGCSVNGRGNSAVLFNPLNLKKFSVEVVELVKYDVEAMPSAANQYHLLSRSWPAGSDLSQQNRTEIIPYFISMQINESFTNTTSTKGFYQAAFTINRWNTKVSGQAVQSVISATAGYTLAGVEILNPAAVPSPPSVDNLFVTCGFTATPMLTDFVDALTKKVTSVYRIDVFYTEPDVISQSSPGISMALSSTGTGVINCWSYQNIDCRTSPYSLGTKPAIIGVPTVGTLNFLQFSTFNNQPGNKYNCIDTTSTIPLVVPMFCTVPDDTQVVTKLNYTSATAGLQTVNCSIATLAGLSATYDYDGPPSHCSSDGSVFLGRLLNNAVTPAQSGPTLGLSTNGCQWSSGDTDCNAVNVLINHPDAVLTQVVLSPEGVKINNGGSVLTCN